MVLTPLFDADEHIKLLLYGKPGTGKTISAVSGAHLGPVVVINAEGGVKRGALKRHGIPIEHISTFDAIDFQSLHEFALDRAHDPEDMTTLVIDSCTEVQKMLMETTVANAFAKAQRKGQDRDPFTIERGEWGQNTEMLRRLIRAWRDIPSHVVFTCLLRTESDGSAGPALSPALQNDLIGYVDIIGYTEVVQIGPHTQHVAHFGGDSHRVTKDRFGRLPKWLVNPTLDRIAAYVNGDLTPEDDPQLTEAIEQRKAVANAAADAS